MDPYVLEEKLFKKYCGKTKNYLLRTIKDSKSFDTFEEGNCPSIEWKRIISYKIYRITIRIKKSTFEITGFDVDASLDCADYHFRPSYELSFPKSRYYEFLSEIGPYITNTEQCAASPENDLVSAPNEAVVSSTQIASNNDAEETPPAEIIQKWIYESTFDWDENTEHTVFIPELFLLLRNAKDDFSVNPFLDRFLVSMRSLEGKNGWASATIVAVSLIIDRNMHQNNGVIFEELKHVNDYAQSVKDNHFYYFTVADKISLERLLIYLKSIFPR